MSDEKKRIIDQLEDTALSAGDYVIVDSQTEGTRKFDLGSEITDIRQDLQELEGGSVPTTVRQAIKTLLESAGYEPSSGLDDEMAIISAWASAVTSITLNQSSISISGAGTYQLIATTVPTGGSVTWSSSDTSIATVSSSGLVTGVSNGTATITATSGEVSATCSVTVSGIASLSSISAVYTQSGTVYTTTSLDSLKTDLVVTATYSDSSTSTVASTDYTLSGTLTVGTSTVTVSYGGKTTTFTVTVSEAPIVALYDWDFTESLTDKMQSAQATTNATQSSAGIAFNTSMRYVDLGAIYAKDRTYEIDIDHIERGSTSLSRYARIFMIDSDTNTATGGQGYIITGTAKAGDLFYMNGAWESTVIVSNSVDADGSYYDESTLGLYINNEGYISVYKNTVLLGTSSTALVSPGTHVYIGSSSGDYFDDALFTGFRVYEGNIYE